MKESRLEKKAIFPKENFFSLRFLMSSSMIVINLQLERREKFNCNLLCKSKGRSYKTCEVIGILWKKTSSRWKNQFLPIFLVLPVMLLKTKLFEKELIWLSSLVLCSIRNIKVFMQVCASFKILSVSRRSSLKTQTLEKRAKLQWKNLFDIHLFLSSNLTDFRWQVFDFTLYSSKNFESFKIVRLFL